MTEAEINKILQEQKRSAQLLVRRDRELSKANERLRELDKEKSEFISIAAHQLRTPLSAIKWSQQMLADEDLGTLNDDQKKMIDQTLQSVTRLVHLVNSLLNADHLDTGKDIATVETIDLCEVLTEIETEVSDLAEKKSVELQVECSDSLPYMRANRERIKDLFLNLVDNAVKYTPPSGSVHVRAQAGAHGLTVEVTDSGIGIPEHHRDKLFTRFARADNAKRVDADGSGLGLYIVKKIVERNDGKIEYESAEGEGTTFRVTLPHTVDN